MSKLKYASDEHYLKITFLPTIHKLIPAVRLVESLLNLVLLLVAHALQQTLWMNILLKKPLWIIVDQKIYTLQTNGFGKLKG